MRKITASLLILLLAAVSVYASVKFSGEVVAGYTFSWNDYTSDDTEYYGHLYGQDNLDSEYAKINVTVSNSEESITATLDGTLNADSRLGAAFSFDILKLLDIDSDYYLKFVLKHDDRISAFRAYDHSFALAKNADRIRTTNNGVGFYFELGKNDRFGIRAGLMPKLNAGEETINQHFSWVASAIVYPVNGLSISVGYVYYPGYSAAYFIYKEGEADNTWSAAFNANFAEIAGLDFDIGITASYVGAYIDDKEEFASVIQTTLYGGCKYVKGAVELGIVLNPGTYYGLQNQEAQYTFQAVLYTDYLLPVAVFFGSPNLEEINDKWYVGTHIGVGYRGLAFFIQVAYSTEGTNSDNFCIASGEGLSVTPYFYFKF